MTRIPAVAAAFALLAGLSGCTPYFNVRISGPLEAPVVAVSRAGLVVSSICLMTFSVSERYSDAPGKELWSIRSEVGDGGAPRCIELTNLTYGQAPDGFEVLVPAAPLQTDSPYSVGGMGLLNGEGLHAYGGATVVFSQGRWRSPYRLFGRGWIKSSPDAD